MRQLIASALTVVCLVTAAQAQFLPQRPASQFGTPLSGGIGSSPTPSGFSPYLNLLRGGNSAAVNYYGFVRPQMNMQAQIQAIQAQQQQGTPAVTEPDDPTTPGLVYGTRVRFLSTGNYFLSLGTPALTGPTTTGGFGAGAGRSGTGAGQVGPVQNTLSGVNSILGGFGASPGGRSGPSVPRRR
jgi:hypothetical protein